MNSCSTYYIKIFYWFKKKHIISSYSNIDDIHNMIDDIEKSHGVTQEVSEAFSNSDTLEVDENEVRKITFVVRSNYILNIY